MMRPEDEGLRERLKAQSEETLGKLAQEILENPLLGRAITGALGAREKAAQAQEVAMSAFNLPSAADLERLTRRVRSVSQRVEGLEDALDRIEERLMAIATDLEQPTVKKPKPATGPKR